MGGLSRRGGAVADPFAAGPGSVGQDDQYAAVGPTMPTTETAGQSNDNGNGIADPYATLAGPRGILNRTTTTRSVGNRATAARSATPMAPTDLDGHTRDNDDDQTSGASADPAVLPAVASSPAPAPAAVWASPAPVHTPQSARSTGRPAPIELDAITARLTQDLAELAVIKANYDDARSNDSSSELARQTELREVAAAEVAKVFDAQNTEVDRVIGVVCTEVSAGLDLIGTGMKQVQKGLFELGKVNGVLSQAGRMISDLQDRLDAAIADQ